MSRGLRVPYTEWVTIFKTYSKLTAEAVKAVEKEHPELFADIIGRGNVLRLAIAKVILPELRKWALKHPGIETPEEIYRAVLEAAESIPMDKLAEAVKAVFPNISNEQLSNILKAYEYFKAKLAQLAGVAA